MVPLLLSSVVIPVLVLVFFALSRATTRRESLATSVVGASFDLCIVSIGIAGSMFQNLRKVPDASTYAVAVLMSELILTQFVAFVDKRSLSLGIHKTWQRVSVCLGVGVLAVAIPSGVLMRFGRF